MVTVASLGLSGCSQSKPTDTVSAARPAEVDPPGRDKVTSTRARQDAPDKVCDGVETLFAHMQVQFARWSPEQQPFDAGMAAGVRNLAQGLAVKGRAATTRPVRVQVAANVAALNRLGMAMGGGNNANRVLAAVRQTRAAYAALTTACDPDGDSPADATATVQTPPPPAVKPTRRPTCEKVQSIMVQVGIDLAAWSPEAQPFDEGAAAKWRSFGHELAALAPQGGSAQIRAAITRNAGAFTGIADAMTSRHRDGIDDAIKKAGLAYLDVHRECSLP